MPVIVVNILGRAAPVGTGDSERDRRRACEHDEELDELLTVQTSRLSTAGS